MSLNFPKKYNVEVAGYIFGLDIHILWLDKYYGWIYIMAVYILLLMLRWLDPPPLLWAGARSSARLWPVSRDITEDGSLSDYEFRNYDSFDGTNFKPNKEIHNMNMNETYIFTREERQFSKGTKWRI